MKNTQHSLSANLYERTKDFIKKKSSETSANSSDKEAISLLQELLAHQSKLDDRISRLTLHESQFLQERDFYRDIFNNQPAGLYRIRAFSPKKREGKSWGDTSNPPYHMEYASDRFCEILGLTRNDLTNNPYIIVEKVHPSDKKSFIESNVKANRDIIPFKWEGRIFVNKKTVWIRLESLPRLLANKEILWTGILYDVTGQKKAEEELSKTRLQLEDVLEGANVGTLEWNVQTGKIKFNRIWAKNLGYTNTEIKIGLALLGSKGWRAITHPDDVPYADEMLKRHFSGELPYHKVEVRMRHKKGHWVWIRQEGRVKTWTADGKPLLMYGIHMDITSRKQMEEQLLLDIEEKKRAQQALVDLNNQLEARIAERTSEMLNITTDVEERERNRFSRELHDGMGPLLSTIKLYFQWLADTEDGEKKKIIIEKGNHSIEMAIQTARELARGLSSQFLSEVGYVHALNEFAQQINLTKKIHISFVANTNDRLGNFHELMLYRITTELIKNTLTYAKASKVEIILNYNKTNNLVSFYYSDNGIGFNPLTIRKERKGLGLMNIQQRVQLMKGEININSNQGKGMKVSILFSIEEDPALNAS
ncbi:MAG: PAS domain-containing protein [Paludibacter sp.]|nr:PAS domain-containing protein [Paludibacter sp.]